MNKKCSHIVWLVSRLYISELSALCIFEAISISRATAFNKHNVSHFYENLRIIIEKDFWWTVYDVDETGMTTVHKPRKVISCKGRKQFFKTKFFEHSFFSHSKLSNLCFRKFHCRHSFFPYANWTIWHKDPRLRWHMIVGGWQRKIILIISNHSAW